MDGVVGWTRLLCSVGRWRRVGARVLVESGRCRQEAAGCARLPIWRVLHCLSWWSVVRCWCSAALPDGPVPGGEEGSAVTSSHDAVPNDEFGVEDDYDVSLEDPVIEDG